MRVLALQDLEKREYTAFWADDVFYDDDFCGIGFYAYAGERFFYIPEVSLEHFNLICKKLVLDGYCDVTLYGEIHEYYGIDS